MIASGHKRRGLILFAHGARDPGWAGPFERLGERVRAKAPEIDVRLAFLERMRPDLDEAVADLAAAGTRDIRIVPIFFGQGGHVRRDVPALVSALRERYPAVAIECAPAAGEDESVLEAMAAYCIRALDMI